MHTAGTLLSAHLLRTARRVQGIPCFNTVYPATYTLLYTNLESNALRVTYFRTFINRALS